MNTVRIDRVLTRMQEVGLEQLVVSDPNTIDYLTGTMIEPGERMLALLLRADGAHRMFIHHLFPAQPEGVEVVRFGDNDNGPAVMAPCIMPDKVLGIDKNWPSRFLLGLMEVGAAAGYVNGSLCCDLVRAVKDEEEQEKMIVSSQINDACMDAFTKALRYGVTEAQFAREVKEIYQAHGCERDSFEPIIGFGGNAADPHHANGDTVLEPGMMVLLDVGGLKEGYCSDMTRTFFTAPPTERQLEIYELVHHANEAAEAIIKPGVKLCDIDAAARNVIAEAGYGPNFTHRLGHFIGRDVHEFGDVSANFQWEVEPGMIFSIEPGIYLPGEIGVRIEDLVLVTETGCQVLNHYPKTPTVLNLEDPRG